jgi:hypothetical protein
MIDKVSSTFFAGP